MSYDKYSDIFKNGPPPLKLPPVTPLDVTSALRNVPTCETHCSGRHEIDSVLTCVHCGGQKYAVVLHEWKHHEGHWFNELRPMNGAPAHTDHKTTPTCCEKPMVRR